MTLAQLVQTSVVPAIEVVGGNVEVRRLVADSRAVQPGDGFVVMPSDRTDTTRFLGPAKQAGAVVAVVASAEAWEAARGLGLATAWFPATGHAYFTALGTMARAMTGDPTAGQSVVAVTGTNGKTTTAWILAHARRALGAPTAYLGTLGFQTTGSVQELANTTPFPIELSHLLAQSRADGCTGIALEASSHALDQRRLAGVRVDVGVFTNLTQDHLDYHLTMDRYGAAKRLLMTEMALAGGKVFTAVLNVDDPVGRGWARELPVATVTFGTGSAADWRAEAPVVDIDRVSWTVQCRERGFAGRVSLPFGGQFQIENGMAAFTALVALGYEPGAIVAALASVPPVPGRFEPVANDRGIAVIVDYAHTPDALRQVLVGARNVTRGRLIVVFGCGGDRDRTKRPLMATAAAEAADLVVLTSDNPRTEDPLAILADVREGLPGGHPHHVEPDREQAVAYAIQEAREGDTVLLAGKGHENYQILGTEKHPMDDRVLARVALSRSAKSPGGPG